MAVLAKELPAAGGGDSRGRGHGSDEVAQAIDEAAFEVDGAEEGPSPTTCAPASRRVTCAASSMLRRKRMMPPGRIRRSQARSVAVELRSGESAKK